MRHLITKGALCALTIAIGTAATAAQPYTIPDQVDYQVKRTAPGAGNWEIIKDDYSYGLPEFRFSGPNNDVPDLLYIPNIRVESNVKNVYLILTFDTNEWDETAPELSISAPDLDKPPALVASDVSLGSGVAYYHWRLTPQPASETITWPGYYGYDMHNGMTSMELGTWCIPTPSGFVLMGLAALPLVYRRR
jgi:hypothetical protein